MDEKFTNIKERVLEFAKYQGIAIEKFLEEIEMTYGSFKGKAKEGALNSNAIEKIYTKYPNLNLEWLITGKGDKLKDLQEQAINNNGNYNNSINGGENINISQNDISDIIVIQKEMTEIVKTSQTQLSESQNQINKLIDLLNKK